MSKLVQERLLARFGEAVVEQSSHCGDETTIVAPNVWCDAAKFLRDDPQCDMSLFIDLTAVDYPDRAERFEVVLHLCSLQKQQRIRLKTRVSAEHASVTTLSTIYAAANWMEREVWDMFGIKFEGHPDLRRLLMYEEFEGHPLRKDYPAEKAQPLVPYLQNPEYDKLAPFRHDEGMSFTRREWTRPKSAWDEEP